MIFIKKKTRTALFLLSLLLFSVLLATFPASAAEPQKEQNYDAYYAEGAKIAWDAFDRHAGDVHTEQDKALFKKSGVSTPLGTFGEGFLSVEGTAVDFSSAFGNDGKTDYTFDVTVAMQKASSGVFYFGALQKFSVATNHNVTATDGFPVDASYGLISNTYVALNSPENTRVQVATDVGWKKVRFIGSPLGKIYSFAVSTDYEVGSENKGTAILNLFRDEVNVQSATLAYPITAWGGSQLSSTSFIFPGTFAFDFYALRYYERTLTEAEMQLNHFVDLAKWFSLSLDVYDTYDQSTREALHFALREEQFDTLTKASLQAIVDNFASAQKALYIEDYITFEGFSGALWGSPALRSVYTVNREAIGALEKSGYRVTVGALLAAENGRDIADITLDTEENVIACEVYQNGALINSVLQDNDSSFRFALTARYDTEKSPLYYKENLLSRAYMTLEKNGKSETYYLDAEGETFGHSLSLEKLSLLLAFLGHTDALQIREVLDEKTIDLAKAHGASFAPVYHSREKAASIAYGIADYLFASYFARAEIMTQTGVSGTSYTYANASPYYKLFTPSHEVRNVAKNETVPLLLQCENAAKTVNFAFAMTSKLYTELLTQQALYTENTALLSKIGTDAALLGLDEENAKALTESLALFLDAHEKTFADAIRDVSVVNAKMNAVKDTLTAPTEALQKLRASSFRPNDLPVFGTEISLSSCVILTSEQNLSSAQMLSSIFSDKYGVFVPYYTAFPESADYACKIYLLDASDPRASHALADNDYLLSLQDGNAMILGKTPSDVQLAAVVFSHSLTAEKIGVTECAGRDIPNLFNTDLPAYLPALTVKAVEDGGVMDRFNQVLLEMPDEYAVIDPISSADYPLTSAMTVYVSPDGNDSADGTYEAPFQTVERAFEYALGKGGVQILLFGGTYRIERALTLSPLYSGSKQSPLYVSAMPGEEVIFSAADTVTGKDFAPVTDESAIARLNTFTANNHENVYVADLAALGITEYGKTTTSGEPLFLIDGEQYNLARFPNKGETLTPLLTAGCVIKQSQVTTGSSYLYPNHNTSLETAPGWKIRIDTASAYRERLEKWTWTDGKNTAESIWMHGALYEEWHRAHYPLVIKEEDSAITVASTVNCNWGVYDKLTDNAASARTSRNGYFYNIMEELDADGEWYLDHKTGKLYVYASAGIKEDARIAMISDTHTLLTLSNASNVVLNGITFAETLGRGLLLSGCENVIVQNCTFRDTRSNGCTIEKSYNTGVISSDFSRTVAAMLTVVGTNDRTSMTPDRIFVQNCRFHDPISQGAINLNGISCLVSHNLFEDTTISFSGAECVLEYNEFARGSQTTYDSGPIYCSGPYSPKGNHIRYNYLHDLNFSLYGIYIDDLSSDNYIYSNIVTYDESVTESSKGVNIHNGHQNVVMNNILVNATDAGVRDNANYYVKTVEYKKIIFANYGYTATLKLRARAYRTATNGKQSVVDSDEGAGGLGYRWPSLMSEALSSYRKIGGADSRFAERFPNVAVYMELLDRQIANANKNASYSQDKASVDWTFTTKDGTTYPWGDMPLRDFLLSASKQELDLYVRAPAYNEYRNNIFLGCSTDIFVYSQWGLLTSGVENNYGFPASSDYFAQAMQGDLSKITQKSTWESYAPGFESIPYEKIGRTELASVTLNTPGCP